MGDGIRVNCVTPGTVDTPWTGRLLKRAEDPEVERAALSARQPTGCLVTADEAAHAIAYLAGPAVGSTTQHRSDRRRRHERPPRPPDRRG
jgi:NAD(P)-dependent dehydrogenase (short-subunit alcohol dehydrogenase family)